MQNQIRAMVDLLEMLCRSCVKKKMRVRAQILIEQLLLSRPVLAQGILVNGYTKSLPLSTDKK